MVVLIILPLACFAILFLLFYRASVQTAWREAFLNASLVVGLFTVFTTESLSLLSLIVFPAVLICWLALLAATLWCWKREAPRSSDLFQTLREARLPKILLVGLALYVLSIAMIAVIAPPNTWDSLEYHMPKVVHWIQNHSVSFYPTAIPRQNHQNPGAEYLVLHLQLLTGSDRFANFVEWFSMIGSLIAVSLIAGLLGAGIRGQLIAAVFAVSLPMGIMQASSTQTDYVVTFWLSCFVYFMLRLIRSKTLNWSYLLALSVALGLAVLTKATAYLYAPPFLAWMTLSLFKAHRFKIVKPLLAFTVIFVAINFSHYSRNYQLHGSPLGPGEEPLENSRYANDLFTPSSFASNTLKNLAIHLQTPWSQVNDVFERAIVGVHDAIGLDVNDRRTTWGPSEWIQFSIRETTFHDEVDGNPLHLIVVIACCILIVASPELRSRHEAVKYILCVLIAFLAFACYIKWSPWKSRQHLSVFVLAAPFCALVLTSVFRHRMWLANSVALLLLVGGIPWILHCSVRPLVGAENIFNASRLTLFFKNPARQDYRRWYQNGRAYLKPLDVSKVGLITVNSSWEYVWWVMLREDNPEVRIEHVNVRDVSRRFYESEPFAGFQPDAVVSLAEETSEQSLLKVNGISYSRKWHQGDTAIFLQN